MLALTLFLAALLLISLLFALVEIHIEGAQGWATSLPTWRIENRWTRLFFGGRALTGYHLYVQLFVLGIVHLPFLIALSRFTWQAEARVIAFFILFWIVEDFLWFILNPAFGLRRFKREHIPWHAPNWWWVMPRDYWVFVPVAAALMYYSRPWVMP